MDEQRERISPVVAVLGMLARMFVKVYWSFNKQLKWNFFVMHNKCSQLSWKKSCSIVQSVPPTEWRFRSLSLLSADWCHHVDERQHSERACTSSFLVHVFFFRESEQTPSNISFIKSENRDEIENCDVVNLHIITHHQRAVEPGREWEKDAIIKAENFRDFHSFPRQQQHRRGGWLWVMGDSPSTQFQHK